MSLPKLDLKDVKGSNPVDAFLSPATAPAPAVSPEPATPEPEPEPTATRVTTRRSNRPRARAKAAPSAGVAARAVKAAFYGSGDVEQRSIALHQAH
jgi:hypothetical protein